MKDRKTDSSVADIEGYYKAVHAATIHSPYCGFSVWMDNHFGVDMCGGYACPNVVDDTTQRSLFIDGTLRKLRARAALEADGAGSTYRLWKQMALNGTGRWIYNVYVVEPSGHALQLNGFLRDADNAAVPVWNQSLCGQGDCSDINPSGPIDGRGVAHGAFPELGLGHGAHWNKHNAAPSLHSGY